MNDSSVRELEKQEILTTLLNIATRTVQPILAAMLEKNRKKTNVLSSTKNLLPK